MPNRENERWLNRQDLIRYCVIHKRYYDAKLGCQLCWLETHKKHKLPQLQICPECGEISLFFNLFSNKYECVNLECSHSFTREESEVIRRIKKQSGNMRDSPEIAEISSSVPNKALLKCPVCLFNTLKWIPERNIYECQYDKCHGRTFEKKELEEIYRTRKAPTKGKSWFGNEYWSPKKKRWKKP